jgi:transcriptional regulator with XRE-family HTH domain
LSSEKYREPVSPKKAFAERLDRELKRRRWTQSELARNLGIKPQVVQGWVSGQHLPTGATLHLLNLWLAGTKAALLTGEGRHIYKVAEAPEDYKDGRRLRLVREIKELACNPDTPDGVIVALLKNVEWLK